jgi:hypothetical protein
MSAKPPKNVNTYETHPDAPHLRYMTVHQDFESRSSITLHVWVPAEYEDILKTLTWHISMFKPEIIASVPQKSPVHKILSDNGQKCTVAVELAHLLCILQYGEYGTIEYVVTTDDDNYDPRSTIIPRIIKDGKEVTTFGIR